MRTLLISVFFVISTSTWADTHWIDVRSVSEFNRGHLEGAINIPYRQIIRGVKEQGIKPEDTLYLYCRSGRRASIAMKELKEKGYNNITNLKTLPAAQVYKQSLGAQ